MFGKKPQFICANCKSIVNVAEIKVISLNQDNTKLTIGFGAGLSLDITGDNLQETFSGLQEKLVK